MDLVVGLELGPELGPLPSYSSLEKLVHLASKVESQISKKISLKNSHNDGFYHSSWKNKNKYSSTFPSNFVKKPI